MKNKDQLLLINRICDEFEAKLQSGVVADIEQALDSAKANEDSQNLVEDLLPELIALQIVYSANRDSTAKSLKAIYPAHAASIEQAKSEPSLNATVNDLDRDTVIENETQVPPSSFARMGERYENLEYLASGGLGDVYTGYDKTVKRQVAIKLLKSQLVANEEARLRFLNEAAITGGLEHPGIVPIYDSGISDDGRPYYVMRLFRGRTMKEDIKELHSDRSAPDFSDKQRQLVRRLADISKAISYAHDNDVIHRDLKPANILLGDYGESIVIDWGLARRGSGSPVSASGVEQRETAGSIPAETDSDALTQAGTILGTPGYMSPEQASGDPSSVGRPADIYSLGAVLSTIIVGHSPAHDSAQTSQTDPASDRFSQDRRSAELRSICTRSMNQNPRQRYTDLNSFAADLECWLSDLPVVAKPDTIVDTAARFFRKNRAWSLIAAATLLTITLSSLAVASAFRTKSTRLARLQEQASADAETQKDLADTNLKLAERERITGLRLRRRLSVLDSYIRLSVQESGNFSKESLKDLILDRISSFEQSKDLSPATMMEHVDSAVYALSLITEHEAALSMYQKHSGLRKSLVESQTTDSQLAKQVYSAVEESKLLSAARQAEPARLVLERVKSDAINKLGVDHDATQNLLRQFLGCLRDRSSERAAEDCAYFGGIRDGLADVSLETTELLYPWLRDLEENGVPDTFAIEELQFGMLYAWDHCSSGKVEQDSSIFQKLFEKASSKFGATEVHTLECLQIHAEAMAKYGTADQALPLHRLLAQLFDEEFGPSSPHKLLNQMQQVRLLLNKGSVSDALKLVRVVRKSALEAGLHEITLMHLNVIYAKTLVAAEERVKAEEILDHLLKEQLSVLGPEKTKSLRKLLELKKKNGRLGEVIESIEAELDETDFWWTPYFPLTVPK